MAKKITKKIKLQIQAAKATPAPPLGPALGQAGINIGDFVTKFNAATAKMAGDKVGVVVHVYEDRTYDFVIKTPTATSLVMKLANVAKGDSKSGSGTISKDKVREIAEIKLKDLTAHTIEQGMKIIEGTARSIGIKVA